MDNDRQGKVRTDSRPSALLPGGTQLGEDSFRRVIEWAPSAMVLIDRNGVVVLVNAQTERMFDYSREALIGQPIEVLVPERFRGNHRAFRVGYLADPLPRPMGAGRDLAGRRSDGSEFPIEIGLNPIETEAGAMVLASIIDITDRLHTKQRLEAALREKTVLLNEVQHRVKNNLQVITSLLNLQSEHAADPRVQAILGESCGRVKAMALTHQLLYERTDLSRLDLGDYLERLVHSIRATYRGTGDRVALNLKLPAACIDLDLDRTIPCGLLVNELVTNAFKHAFPGERHGEIAIELWVTEDDLVCINIADNGVGLPPESASGSPFSLGLQLVALLVEQLHGTLTVERNGAGNEGDGVRFSVCFPK